MIKLLKSTVLLSVLTASSFAASVIDFEGFAPTNGLTTESGTRIEGAAYFTTSHGHIFDSGYANNSSGYANNGTDWYLHDNGNPLTVGLVSNAGFSLTSFDWSQYHSSYGQPTSFSVTGNFVGGGSISQSFITPATLGFQTYAFSGAWTNLANVQFAQTSFNSNTVFDNIVLNGSSASVPDATSSLALTAAGLGLLGFFRRRFATKR